MSPQDFPGLYAIPDEEFERTIAINVTGVYLCTKRLIPLLLESDDPRVINVGSTSGVMSQSLRGAYGVSKAGLHALTIATAGELSGRVAVNALSPGWVKTDMAPDAPKHPRTSAEAASVAGQSAQGGHRPALPRHGGDGLERVTRIHPQHRL